MITKLENYWFVVHGVIRLAIILDSRYMLILLEYFLSKFYEHEAFVKIKKI